MAQGNFFSELKRRNVYRVGVAYAVAAFMLLEVVSNAAPFFELPLWIGRALVLLLIAGFPAALCFAWAYEITPDGLKRTAEVAKDTSITHHTAHRLNIVIVVLLVALAGLYGADRFLPARETTGNGTQNKAPAAQGSVSIAVLPFVNLSGDPSQEFFSDGMTEEITSALAKVRGLKVVGRTSAFEFKGQNKDLRAIGQTLGATNILEGSVRKSGNRVRITGQLIRADDGTHVWTENYDRELTDIFATQDDIARAIAGALRVPLGLAEGQSLVTSRSGDTSSYQDYLRARALFRTRVPVADGQINVIHQTIDALEGLTARDAAFAPAWALLAMAYAGEPSTVYPSAEDSKHRVDLYLPKAEAAGRRAVALDPRSADAYAGLAFALQSRGKYVEAADFYKQALQIDPFNPELLHFYAQSLKYGGRVKEAAEIRRRLFSLEPLVPNFNTQVASDLISAGMYEEALAPTKALPEPLRTDRLVALYVLMGRPDAAAEALINAPAGYRPEIAAAAIRLLRMPPAAVAPRDLPELTGLPIVYLHAGDRDRAFLPGFDRMETDVAAGYHYPGLSFMWAPAFGFARKTERFKAFLRKAGLVEYWRARGWPDLCRPVGADDFVCD